MLMKYVSRSKYRKPTSFTVSQYNTLPEVEKNTGSFFRKFVDFTFISKRNLKLKLPYLLQCSEFRFDVCMFVTS